MSFHRIRLIPLALLLSTIGLASGPVLAKSNSVSTQMKHVDLRNSVKVNGSTLSPGKYDVIIDNGKATFELNGQKEATADCDWKTLPSKAAYDSVTTDKDVLQEIDFAGSTQALQLK